MKRREFMAGTAMLGSAWLLPRPVRAAGPEAAAAATLQPPAAAGAPGAWLLDEGWRFCAGDFPAPRLTGQDETYDNAKAGKAWGAASPDFDDSTWRPLRLPHDFAVEQPFDPQGNIAQGFKPRGIAWYRRSLRLDEACRGKSIELHLDGVASHATVWVNGVLLARHANGYTSLYVDITALAQFGQAPNTIAVRVDAEAMDGWWYEGAGLYRHAWLVIREPVHIVSDGLSAVPRLQADGRWQVPVEVQLANTGEQARAVQVAVWLEDQDGRTLAQGRTQLDALAPLGQACARVDLQVADPARWSPQSPTLYTVRVRVGAQGQPDEAAQCRIGFRTLRFDAREGFFLNEVPTKIKGVCLHQDHAGVGVAVPDALLEFRMRRLKSMGCNAVRLHHAVARELLDVCDRLGLLVLGENRVFSTAPDNLEQLRWMVRRDRSRACVFMWSLLNEEPLQGTQAGYEMARRLAAEVRALDDSRPLTAAMNDGMLTARNVADAVDVLGFNYRQFNYDRVHAQRLDTPLLSSEDTSAFQTRGAWFTDLDAHVIAEDDTHAAPWGNTHRQAWKLIAERPYIAGSFVWTGFDYRGEPSPFEWPSVASFFGILDQCGFAKGAYWLRRALWIDEAPVLQLMPHWTWPGREGQPIKVIAYANVEEVALWLNGRALGRQRNDRFADCAWQLPYEPGVLEAVGYSGGREVARHRVQTAGAPVALRLVPDRARMRGDGQDAQPVMLEALDAQGCHVPTANLPVQLSIRGGRVLGVGNGDPNRHAPDAASAVDLFNGLAQAIVQGEAGARGLRLEARSPGLRPARLDIELLRAPAPPSVPVVAGVQVVGGWRHTQPFLLPPDPALRRAPNDNNSWSFFQPGNVETRAEGDGYVLYRTQFTPWAGIQQRGGWLRLGRCTGPAQVFLDGRPVARAAAGEPVRVPVPAGAGERTLVVILQVVAGAEYGLRDVVSIEY
ncbi:beta-galactosidase GalA [Pseudoxanthomonas winnipegensis]|uniref:beta-galactosidase GalA n=1 Tax=Pseudoxanthomonas winnipegensis TaxID=2480810 RepID=UPI003F82E41F